MQSKKRATPLSPEERRSSIVAAVTNLILETGAIPTTSEIAISAGVAEGTVFSVFPDKHSIFHAVVERSVDPTATIAALEEVHEGAPLDLQLAEAARIMRDRLERTINLVMVLRAAGPPPSETPEQRRRAFIEADSGIIDAITDIFDRSGSVLAMPADRLAMAFRTLIFASAHPLFAPGDRLTVDEIVAIVLAAAGIRQEVS